MVERVCDCRLGRKCVEHEYCADGRHVFHVTEYDRPMYVYRGGPDGRSFWWQHVVVRSCELCDRHESEVTSV